MVSVNLFSRVLFNHVGCVEFESICYESIYILPNPNLTTCVPGRVDKHALVDTRITFQHFSANSSATASEIFSEN